ncbi:MAG: hypothetical protein JWQ83_1759 [Lacunisphaera sp.]|nr:hypothetical protein [Lacunisphaera sp.]MDB6166619.1 hypothetical protein [Lacunisphaera sp.]
MELNLHPIATKCFVSGRDFQENDRVVCYLARLSTSSRPGDEATEIARRDVLESEDKGEFPPAAGGPELVERAFVYCRWVVAFKQRKADENPALTLKLTAENLFLTLAGPESEPSAINTPLLQFLALMMERKKLIKPRGKTEDGLRQIYEHMATHQLYEVPVGDLNVEFFQKIQEHLGVLVGTPKPRAVVAPVVSTAP